MTPEQKRWWQGAYETAQTRQQHWSSYDYDYARWPNFQPQEFACNGSAKLYLDKDAMDALQEMREIVNKPFIINSAYRTPLYNKQVGGSEYSMHQLGLAFDISTKDHDADYLQEVAEDVGFKGIGRYSTFIHVDMRPWRARW